ncbi:sulfotransferase family protein [Novosphingobium lentum]|uniref:sulfotransferase family protein n=1 Tax=Novosphingobium lentum TaxID=145287 RepID=UPI000A441904|nr:sulfotransferase [Novosphingobium lentum]
MMAGRIEDFQPEFIVIGAVKAATTWIQKQLQANPALFLPDVEPHYFSSEFARGPGYYQDLFSASLPGACLGEKSADYLAHLLAPARIASALPDARLIAQFRNPVDRAYSDYKMLYRRGTITGRPEEYLISPDNPQPRFLNDGRYAYHLSRWLDHFPEEQLLTFLYEDVKADPSGTIERVSRHIGVDPVYDAQQGSRRENDSSENFLPLPVRKVLAPVKSSVAPLRGMRWFEATRSLFARQISYPPLSPDLRRRLTDFYARDVEMLGAMIGRDLSRWLDAPRCSSAA